MANKFYTDTFVRGKMTNTLKAYEGITFGHTLILKGIIISNGNATAEKTEILISKSSIAADGVDLIPYVKAIPAGDVLVLNDLHMPIPQYSTIWARCETTSYNMHYFIWGIDEQVTT